MSDTPAQEKQPPIYELGFLLRTEDAEPSLEAIVKEHGGIVMHKAPLNQIQLAYPIKKQESGYFGFYHLQFPNPEGIKELTNTLQLKDFLLRSLLIKLPKEKEKKARKSEKAETAPREKKEAVTNLDALSNEKLEEKLEEILK